MFWVLQSVRRRRRRRQPVRGRARGRGLRDPRAGEGGLRAPVPHAQPAGWQAQRRAGQDGAGRDGRGHGRAAQGVDPVRHRQGRQARPRRVRHRPAAVRDCEEVARESDSVRDASGLPGAPLQDELLHQPAVVVVVGQVVGLVWAEHVLGLLMI
ncbi:EF hand domain containing protein [Acanthamoeba castellanii str. Neff]|uniref:EF hand domain containing protein n=1 Tax=Acanthamoeba castellanii (strain ATCC 30010 / Neff) TaxID=1257118 RepID=L8GH33_ACACF|nr:EF hand domain containing protein [Acanthamoeba castellanii str. Neff]ELR12124.1 EF hand domain containing protein [Acanthamoeba castellanii str. Neff]